jgi:hypothetical protein
MTRAPVTSPAGAASVPLLAALVTSLGVFAAVRLTADPDLWGHVRFGLDMLRDRALPSHDPYSFTSTIPWINHEWLAELAMAAAWTLGGSAGLVALKTCLVGAALWLSWSAASRAGAGAAGAWASAGVVTFGALNRTGSFRPQVFALCACALLCSLLLQAHRRSTPFTIVSVAVVLALWANVHGSWFLGVLIVVLWASGAILARTQRGWWLGAVPGLAVIASLATPYGVSNWSFLVDTVRVSRPEIADWVPAWNETGLFMTWLVPALACALALVMAPSRRRLLPWLLPACALGIGALRLARVDMVFACVAAAALAEAFAARSAIQTDAESGGQAGRWLIAAAVMLIILGPRARAMGENVRCIPVDRQFAENAAIRALASAPAGARVLTFFDYGEYAIWHLGPRVLVSMDGRRETVYAPETIAAHLAFYDDPLKHRQYADELRAEYVWVPSELRFRTALSSAGWIPIFAGPVSTVWGRTSTLPVGSERAGPGPTARAIVPRCFPAGTIE